MKRKIQKKYRIWYSRDTFITLNSLGGNAKKKRRIAIREARRDYPTKTIVIH